MRDFLHRSSGKFPASILSVVTAALLSAGLTGVCMLFLLKAYSTSIVHDMNAIMRSSVAETRHQDECEFADNNSKDCRPPLVFDELPDPNEPISL